MSELYKLGKLYAAIDTDFNDSVASALGIPPMEERQPDLQYFTSVYVSSGFNLNAAYFLPSELIEAERSIIDKPLDIEHEQDKIVGHLYASAYTYKADHTKFDPSVIYSTLGSDVDKLSIDILTATRLYRTRFPGVAARVSNGEYKVSMECFYRDYDIIVDNIIIPKAEAMALGLTEVVNNTVRVVAGKEELGSHTIGRVLRGIHFSGCGLVEKPANPDSLILETAAVNDGYILDLTKIDSYMKAKKSDEEIVIHKLEGAEKDNAYISASYGGAHGHENASDSSVEVGGAHLHVIDPKNLPEDTYVYFVKDGEHKHSVEEAGNQRSETEHTHKVYVEGPDGSYYSVESSPPIKEHAHCSECSSDEDSSCFVPQFGAHQHTLLLKDDAMLKTVTPQDVLNLEVENMSEKDKKEEAGTPDICVSFKRYVYDKGGDDPGEPADYTGPNKGMVPQVPSNPAPDPGGAGETITQNDKIIHENWCSLFDVPCPVPGGMAVHPDCVRVVLDRTTKDAVNSYYEKLQENRKKEGISELVASLAELVEEAKKII